MISGQPSPELIAANERLLHMRAQYRAERTDQMAHLPLELFNFQESKVGNPASDKLELITDSGHYSAGF